MSSSSLTSESVAQRGQELYDREIRAEVEPQNTGKFLILDVETGYYEIDESDIAALRRFKDKRPGALVDMSMLWGYRVTLEVEVGGGVTVEPMAWATGRCIGRVTAGHHSTNCFAGRGAPSFPSIVT